MKQNCANISIQVFNPSNDQWNRDLIFFLTRRLGYSVDYDLMSHYLKFSPSQLVDKIIDEALSKEVKTSPANTFRNNASSEPAALTLPTLTGLAFAIFILLGWIVV